MPAPDFATAREYYEAAEAEVAAAHYDEALRDYQQAYELTKDPVLFYKLAATQERAGHCDRAISLYQRYLDEAHPAPDFEAAARAHMAGCAPRPAVAAPVPVAAPAAPVTPAPTPKLDLHMAPSRRAAWLLAGASGGLVVVGAILAYAASSSENDVRDLYVGTNGLPPQYAGATKTRYAQLLVEGKRYEHESWAAFGAAGGAALGAAVCFWLGGGSGEARITPVVTSGGGGVRVRF
jgi:tetratricopeptide (TPR) repeat protein